MIKKILFFIIFYFILLFFIIDKNYLYFIFLLLFNSKLFTFLRIGYEMEYNKNFSYIITYLIRIFILIYILLFPIINFFYVLFSYHKYNYPIYKQYYEICKNPFIMPIFECSLVNGMNTSLNNIDLFIKMQNKFFGMIYL